MHILKFHGYSDDTFGEYGKTGQDVDNCGSLEPVQCIVDCGERGRLMVIGQYSKASLGNGCWMVGISKTEAFEKCFERAGIPHMEKRIQYAYEYMEMFAGL